MDWNFNNVLYGFKYIITINDPDDIIGCVFLLCIAIIIVTIYVISVLLLFSFQNTSLWRHRMAIVQRI